MVYTYWLDEKNRPTRVTCCSRKQESITVDYTDWGIKTDIKVPAADQIIKTPSFLNENS